MAGDPDAFPQHLRKLTETNVEQARAAYAQFVDAMTQAMDLCLNAMPQNEMTAGLKVVQGQVMRFGKRNIEAGLNLASDLANATSLRDMLDIQTTYAQTQLHVLRYQTQELARLMAKVELAVEEVKAPRRGVHENLILWRPRAAAKQREEVAGG